ncbi:hypothetical protein [Streptomyces sp. G1]|uniref:hypothetical protein n=1 Tax=Streptomyces sp. G1 TaxID=361572 RepID=UPI00202E49AD|nr:hypothetical protein [Streptomyces sp. G1]MCM1976448.1 hypothetical protein [Streptomyces sp. G1]
MRTVEDGRFTVEVPVNGRVSALVDHKESGWLSSTYATVAVDPSTSAGFHGGTEPVVSADRKVTLGGKLYAYDIPAPTELKVVVEFRREGTEEWVVKATRESAAPAGDSTRVVTVAGLPYPGAGHWRDCKSNGVTPDQGRCIDDERERDRGRDRRGDRAAVGEGRG